MALLAPKQQRTADPFSENRYSSTVNRFTRIISHGNDMIIRPEQSFIIQVVDWHTLKIRPGIFVKDDVLIHITDEFDIDFADQLYYVDDFFTMNAEGYYTVLIQYNYARTLPAPKAYYRIVRQEELYTHYAHQYLYLCNIYVRWNAGGDRFEIDTAMQPFYQHPDNPDIKRSVSVDHALVLDGGELGGS